MTEYVESDIQGVSELDGRLILAVLNDDLNAARQAWRDGADPNKPFESSAAAGNVGLLYHSVKRGSPEMTRFLITAKAVLERSDEDHQTAVLLTGLFRDKGEHLEALAAAGANLYAAHRQTEDTVAHKAAQGREEGPVRVAWQYGVDFTTPNHMGLDVYDKADLPGALKERLDEICNEITPYPLADEDDLPATWEEWMAPRDEAGQTYLHHPKGWKQMRAKMNDMPPIELLEQQTPTGEESFFELAIKYRQFDAICASFEEGQIYLPGRLWLTEDQKLSASAKQLAHNQELHKLFTGEAASALSVEELQALHAALSPEEKQQIANYTNLVAEADMVVKAGVLAR